MGSFFFFFFFTFLMLIMSFQWWRDVVYEGVYEGSHTCRITAGLDMGVVGFIISEICFFFSFFWIFFYFSLSPDFILGFTWPPLGVFSVRFLGVPFLNTLILLSSGFFITLSHLNLVSRFSAKFFYSYFFGLALGGYFLLVQFYEYYNLSYDFRDGRFGCAFYILTGFHGFHVLLGFVFLFINFIRFYIGHFSTFFVRGFDYSVWYWHFVDVVWLFLYLFVYWWGGCS